MFTRFNVSSERVGECVQKQMMEPVSVHEWVIASVGDRVGVSTRGRVNCECAGDCVTADASVCECLWST